MARWLAVLALAGWLTPAPAQEPAPGKAAELARRLGDADGYQAAVELYRLGAGAVPALVQRWKEGWPEGSDETAAALRALLVLEHLGPEAEPAFDPLVESLRQDRVRRRVFEALGRTAPYLPARAKEVSKKLGDECDQGNYFGETGFFALLSRLTFDASAPVADLLRGLEHDNPYVRELAAEALATRAEEIRADGDLRKRVVSALIEAIEGEHPDDFRVEWLWNGGQATTQGSASNAKEIRAAAAYALSFFTPEDPRVVPGLRRRLQHIDPLEQVEAARALGALGKDVPEQAVADLARMLSEAPPLAAREAATALGMIGPAARSAIPDLTRAAESGDSQLAARARAALRQIDK